MSADTRQYSRAADLEVHETEDGLIVFNPATDRVHHLNHSAGALFELDSDVVALRYDDGVLARVAERMRKRPAAKVALIGRASRIGDLRYNRRLSARRSLAVRDRLLALGVPADRIKTMWFGWEPPQIQAEIAAEYGFATLFAEQGEERMNQSVLAVLYEPEAVTAAVDPAN